MAAPRSRRRWSWTTGNKGKNRVPVYDRGSGGIFLVGSVRDPLTGSAIKDVRQVRTRAVEQDLRLLLAVLNWAAVVRDANGNRLLTENPFAGLTVPREENSRGRSSRRTSTRSSWPRRLP
jgi:hypothetical protein